MSGTTRRWEKGKNLFRMLTFVFERFGEHELSNHAAAGAYAFLLSATPALLLVIGLSSTLLSAWPAANAAWLEFTGEVFQGLGANDMLKGFFSRQLGVGAAILAFLSLVWAARLFILTVQRGIRVIWGISPLAKPMRDNIVTFALEFAALVLVVLVLGAADAFRFFLDYLQPLDGERDGLLSRIVMAAIPLALLFLYSYLTYRFIPPQGPKARIAALAALICTVVYAAFSAVLSFAIDRTHYDLLYGVFGGLIVLLLKVWMFFMVYFHCAELSCIYERFDSILFARFLRVSRLGKPGRLASLLFERPHRIISRYGATFEKGEVLFREGDRGKDAYFLLEGEVGVYLDEGGVDRKVAVIQQGELFGEIAELIAEGRTATTIAETFIEVIILPPALFESLLKTDADTSRRLIDLLSLRLKESNLRLASEGAMTPFVERRSAPRK